MDISKSQTSPSEIAPEPTHQIHMQTRPTQRCSKDMTSEDLSMGSPTPTSGITTAEGALASPRIVPVKSTSQSSLNKSYHGHSHRSSFAENMRMPPSPHSQRHPSFTHSISDVILPQSSKQPNPKFANRDWRDISVGELVSKDDLRWAQMDTSVEEASMMLIDSPRNVVLVRDTTFQKAPVSTFDYSDLNAYLLVVVGLAHAEDEYEAELFQSIHKKAQAMQAIPLREIQPICHLKHILTLPADAKIDKAIEVFGSGVHRMLVMNNDGEVIGILSQLRLMDFFWTEAVYFPSVDRLYRLTLRDLDVGSRRIIAVNADKPLADALVLMDTESLSSVAVVDNGEHVVGNISTVDVKHLTSAANAHLLRSSCMSFISYILTEAGTEKGRDSVPVFHVSPSSTLAHTVAKLVATRAHRVWIVETVSPSSSTPATPGLSSTVVVPVSTVSPQSPGSMPPTPVPASAMPGAHVSGRLSGVVSLSDILNLFAKSTGLLVADPGEHRARRRKSSSSSVRPSMESFRSGC